MKLIVFFNDNEVHERNNKKKLSFADTRKTNTKNTTRPLNKKTSGTNVSKNNNN